MLKDAIEYEDKHILRMKSNYPEEDTKQLLYTNLFISIYWSYRTWKEFYKYKL